MMADSFALALPVRIASPARSLSDPRVLKVAQSLPQNLRDPATRRRSFFEANEILSASTEVSLSQELLPAEIVMDDQTPYVRNAIRTYLEIAAMK